MKGRVKDDGIILKISPYGDSSLIIHVMCRHLGSIGILAKGVRQKPASTPLLLLSSYELSVYEPLESGLYLYCEASLMEERSYPLPKHWSTALSGTELISHLVVAADEHELYYDLLRAFLDHLIRLEGEPLPVFWRLFVRIMQLQGLKLQPDECSACGMTCSPSAYLKLDSSLVCHNCAAQGHSPEELINLSPRASELLLQLPAIGNYLKGLRLDRAVVRELNEFFSSYHQAHMHQTLKLKSLSVLEQLY